MKFNLSNFIQSALAGIYVFLALHAGLVLAEPAKDALPVFTNEAGLDASKVSVDRSISNTLDINIKQDKQILDFKSHDIGVDGTVNYRGNTNFQVLGNIHDQSASQIFGTLNSEVNLTLINRYGFIFGPQSVVNATSLTVSALNSANPDDPFDINNSERNDLADFNTLFTPLDADGNPIDGSDPIHVYTGTIEIQQGADITAGQIEVAEGNQGEQGVTRTGDSGNLFFFAPQAVKNDGELNAKDGQIILAAGSKIYLAEPDPASNESNILVEVEITKDHVNSIETINDGIADSVDKLVVGEVQNAVGQIFADRGVITLLGASVHNNGVLSANTSVNQGGKIRLLAGSNLEQSISSETLSTDLATVFDNDSIGIITLGSNSRISANPDTSDGATAVEADPQPQGEIEFLGKKITFGTGSRTVAKSGAVNIYNTEDRNTDETNFNTLSSDDDSLNQYEDFEVAVENGAVIDVSGLNTKTSVAKNFVTADLLSNELADSTLAKNNEALREVLRQERVTVDARDLVEFDGEVFEGTALGDISGFVDLIESNVAERSVFGGDITIESRNAVDIQANALLNVSGGSIQYTPEKIITTKLFEEGTNRLVDIGDARPDRNYTSILDADSTIGQILTNATPVTPGYLEGKSAGVISINAEQIKSPLTARNLKAETVIGDLQTLPGITNTRSNRPSLARNLPEGGKIILGNASIRSNITQNAARIGSIVLDKSFSTIEDDVAYISTDLFSSTQRNGRRYNNFTGIDANASDSISIRNKLVLPGEGKLDFTSRVINVLDDIVNPSGNVGLYSIEAIDSSDTQAEQSIFISSASQIDLSGTNVNRNLSLTAPSLINGGVFEAEFTALSGENDGKLTIESGGQIDVSAGVEYERNLIGPQNANLGQGGSINIDITGLGESGELNVVNRLSAFKGYGVSTNGETSLGGSISISTEDDYICVSGSSCDFETITATDNVALYQSSFFRNNGFSDFDLNTSLGEVVVDASLTLKPYVQRIQLSGNNITSSIGPVSDLLAKPTSLKLSSGRQFYFSDTAAINASVDSVINFATDNSLFVGGTINAKSGEVIFNLTNSPPSTLNNENFDNTIALWLADTARIDVGSTVQTQTINGFTVGDVYESGSIIADSQRGYIVVEDGARLSSNGLTTSLDQANFTGGVSRNTISTAGGTISLNAGERILFFGDNSISLKGGSNRAAGGSLLISIDPSNRLQQFRDEDQIRFNDYPFRHAQIFVTENADASLAGVQLEFGDGIEAVTGLNLVQHPGQLVGDSDVARTTLSTALLDSSGADNVTLKTVDMSLNNRSSSGQDATFINRQSQILIDDGLNLDLGGVLTLNASEFIMPDEQQASATINAYAVRLGSSNNLNNRIFPGFNEDLDSSNIFNLRSPSENDNQELVINASIIDIFGDSVINNIKKLSLNSATDIRAIGIPQVEQEDRTSLDLAGSLQMQDVDLTLSARQIYPTTLSQFTLSNRGDNSTITTKSPTPGVIPITPYSVGGELSVLTRNLSHGGVFRAPEGIIRLNSDKDIDSIIAETDASSQPVLPNIEVTNSGVVSVSANGSVLPFAQVLIDEVPIVRYQSAQYRDSGLADQELSRSFVYNADNADLLREKLIEIGGDSIALQDGSQIDFSGGGVLLSTQFNRGLLGTKDIINSGTGNNVFVLAPRSDYAALAAPIDPSVPSTFDIYGETVTLSSSAYGLPAGEYVKLPAEYALLPNHVLVEEVSGFDGIQSGDTITQLDGSIVVAGFEGSSNGKATSTELKAFKVQNRSVIDRRASYSTFNFGALVENVIQPNVGRSLRTTLDAGIAQFNAATQLTLDGAIRANAGSTFGQQGAIDISSNNIRIVKDGFSEEVNGTLLLTESQISNLNVESILLGGSRFSDDLGATAININTQSVEFDNNVDLSVGELIVVAKGNNDGQSGNDSLVLNNNVSITAESDAPISQGILQAPNEGSILVVSDVTDWQVKLPENPVTADAIDNSTLDINDGVALNGAASIVIGSVNEFNISDSAAITAEQGTVSLLSNEINLLGDNNTGIPSTGSVASDRTLSNLEAAKVALLASENINLLGNVEVVRENLTIHANSIVALEGLGGSASSSLFDIANRLELGGGTELQDVNAGTGTIIFKAADEIALLGGTINFAGFSSELNNSTNSISFDAPLLTVNETSRLNLSGGLDVKTNDIRFGIGNDLTIEAMGGADFSQSTQGTINLDNPASRSLSLFSQFELNTLGDVNINTQFTLNSGKFEINTNGGDIEFGNQAQLNLSGELISIGEEVIATRGGLMVVDTQGAEGVGDGNITFSQPDEFLNQSTINLDGAQGITDVQGADAGVMALFAGNGNVNNLTEDNISAMSTDGNGGSFILDEADITSQQFTDLNNSLNAKGFTYERSLRTRSGDINLDAEQQIIAEKVRLIADQGNINIAGAIMADSDEGGYIGLFAQQDLNILQGAELSARLLTEDQFAESRIDLSSRSGNVDLAQNSNIKLSRIIDEDIVGNGGSIFIRANRGVDSDSVDGADSVAANIQQANEVFVSNIDSSIEGADAIIVGGYAEYDLDVVDETAISTIRSDTDVFGAVVDTISDRLSTTGNDVIVVPGIEILSQNTINIISDIDFSDWRYGLRNVAPQLVIASAQDILVGGLDNPVIISDGFDEDLAILVDEYNVSTTLIAGSDLTSADITQTLSSVQVENLGNIIIAEGRAAVEGGGPILLTIELPGSPPSVQEFSGTIEQCLAQPIVLAGFGSCSGGGEGSPLEQSGIRSGTGDINLIAAGNIEFGNEYAGVYTAGRKLGVEDVDYFTLTGLNNLAYGEQGGNVSLSAGQNIIGADSQSTVNDWIWKTDLASLGLPLEGAAGWTANPASFTGDVATLGGGNVSIRAGNDLNNLDVSIASIGKQVGTALRSQGVSQVEVVAGGNLDIYAQGNITTPKIHIGKGRANIEALGSIGDQQTGGAIVSLADAKVDIIAGDDLLVERVFNPTITLASQTQLDSLPSATGQGAYDARFFTYSEQSSVDFRSNAGTFTYVNSDFLGQSIGVDSTLISRDYDVLPGHVKFTALTKDLIIGDGDDRLYLFPNARGNFDFLSGGNIQLGADVVQLDLPQQLTPVLNASVNVDNNREDASISNDFANLDSLLSYDDIILNVANDPSVRATYDLRTANLHLGVDENGTVDNQNNRIIANGSIDFARGTEVVTAEATDILAGMDIISPNLLIQNLNSYDVSTLSAGRSIITEFSLGNNGAFNNADENLGILVDGPGRLDVVTSESINLGASQGILSRANTINTALSSQPATINLLAGFTNYDSRINQFIDAYLRTDDSYDNFIREFLLQLSQEGNQTYGTLISNIPLLKDSNGDDTSIGRLSASEYDDLLDEYENLQSDSLASPFLTLTDQELLALDQISNGVTEIQITDDASGDIIQTISINENTGLRNIFLNLDERQQFNVVLKAFNNEIFTSGETALLATNIGLGTAGFYAGYQQSFNAIRTLFPEHSGALNLLQNQINSNGGLVGVDTSNPQLVSFISELYSSLATRTESNRDAIISQIQENISDGVTLTTAINQPLASNNVTNSSGELLQITDGVANLVGDANDVSGQEIAEFVQTLQIQNNDLFLEDIANINTPFNLVGGEVGGDINVLAPFGFYNVGGDIDTTELGVTRGPGEQGIISGGGAINLFLGGDLFVNLQRVVGIGDEALNLYSLFDNIDAGSGAKTSIAVSPANYVYDLDGQRSVTFPPSFAGSGIRKLEDADGNQTAPGLFTPYGIVDAGDAGIVSDSGISIAALDVQNDSQINSDGGEAGATTTPAPPPPTVDAGASNAASNTASNDAVDGDSGQEDTSNAFSDDAAAFLNVFVIGVGDDSESSSSNSFDSASAEGVNTNSTGSDGDESLTEATAGCRPDDNGIIPENCISSL